METTVGGRAVDRGVLRKHLAELAALWRRREEDLFAAHLFARDLARVEERAAYHLDGLVIGAEHAFEIARPHLAGKDWSEATAAAFTLLAADRPDLDAEVFGAFARGPEPAREGIRIALRHAEGSRLARPLAEAAEAGPASLRAAAADVLAFRRLPAPRGLDALAADADPAIRVLAYGAIGRFGGPWGGDYLERALASDDARVQRAALEASARLGMPGIERYCRGAAMRAGTPSAEALRFLGVIGDDADLGFLQNLSAAPGLAEAALDGLGAMGRPEVVPALLPRLADAAVSRAAADALARITGCGRLDAPSAAAFWRAESRRFEPGRRYQDGVAWPETPTVELLDRLPLAWRRDAHLRHRYRSRSAPDLELEARFVPRGAIPSGAC